MFKKGFIGLSLLLFSIISFGKQFDSIIAFGDSLSDNGNLYKFFAHIMPQSPPYYNGRFSNGPVWVENLYDSLFPNGKPENFQDYAVGGAGAVISYKENLPYTLTSEVDNYLYLHKFNNPEKTLYTVWIGANNYLNGPTNVDAITNSVVGAIDTDISRLIKHGGTMFLIINLPDLGKTPAAKLAKSESLLTRITEEHNRKLLQKYEELKEKYPAVDFVYFDVYSLFEKLQSAPEQFSITNTQDPCFGGGFFRRNVFPATATNNQSLAGYLDQQAKQNNLELDEKTQQAILENPVLREALENAYQAKSNHGGMAAAVSTPISCTGYLFWDHVHPTGFVHETIAQQIKTLIEMSGLQAVSQ